MKLLLALAIVFVLSACVTTPRPSVERGAAIPKRAQEESALSVTEFAIATRAELPDAWQGQLDEYLRRARWHISSVSGDADVSVSLESVGLRWRGEMLLRDGEAVAEYVEESPMSPLVRSDTGADFAYFVREKDGPYDAQHPTCTIIRKRTTQRGPCPGPYGHAFFVGEDLLMVESDLDIRPAPDERNDDAQRFDVRKTLTVRREGVEVFRREYRERVEPNPEVERPAFGNVAVWGARWGMELTVDADVWMDGVSVKASRGYEHAFALGTSRKRPIYLFVGHDGKLGVNFDGRESPERYDEILEGMCCDRGGLNPVVNGDALRFHARRGGTWLFVVARGRE